MPEIDEHDADDQPELVVRRVAGPQDDGPGAGVDAADQEPAPEARTRGGGVMDQGQS
ncbi:MULTISPECIES: hypothetical protein [unclassified Streptomyces]|uniref:hypothetical protein n=1 Tax=unclassified Streptomyces TaxID=2593676 RepID=UPI00225C3191|nr:MULTISPECIES: hypothetical protein [unclassified Streptomyces]MCX5404056.1 hypothetical protein [Streptomyces sp. NBC_00086]